MYGSVKPVKPEEAPAPPPKKALGRKMVAALAACALVGGLAAVTTATKTKTTTSTELFDWARWDPSTPNPYTKYEPNSVVCGLGCGFMCKYLRATDSTRITCCTKEECADPATYQTTPATVLPPVAAGKSCPRGRCNQSGLDIAGQITCAGGNCDQSSSKTQAGVTCAGGGCNQQGVAAQGPITCAGGQCDQTGATSPAGVTCPTDPCLIPAGGGVLKEWTGHGGHGVRRIPEFCKAPTFDCNTQCSTLPTHDDTLTCCQCA
jgi:hypothetical protein